MDKPAEADGDKAAVQRQLLIVLMPDETFGPLNNFIGIANVLSNHLGHRVVFLIDSCGKGKVSKYGFEEKHFHSSADSEDNQFYDDFVEKALPEFQKPPFEQWKTFTTPILKTQIDSVKYSNEQIKNFLQEVKPDVIVQDAFVSSPAILNNSAGIPFVRFISVNPLAIPDEHKKPPPYCGVSSLYSSTTQIMDCWTQYDSILRPIWNSFNEWIQTEGCVPLPDLDFVLPSPYLNIYLYPEVIDYQHGIKEMDRDRWFRIDSCVRDIDPLFEFPQKLVSQTSLDNKSALIYVSLGTLGCEDTRLMKKLIAILGRSKHRYIFSLGPKYAHYDVLPENIWGKESVPQTKVIPLVDLVITHGGNNTVTDCFYFGKPMIVLPMFWDQHDNATRISETGYGLRLDTYMFTEHQINDALRRLLSDENLKVKLADISKQIRAKNGVEEAARQIQRIGK